MIIINRLKNHIYSISRNGSVIEGLSLTNVFQYIAEKNKPMDVRFKLGPDSFTFRFEAPGLPELMIAKRQRDIQEHTWKDSISALKPRGWLKWL